VETNHLGHKHSLRLQGRSVTVGTARLSPVVIILLGVGCKEVLMTASGPQMNRFERVLFRIAVVLAGILIAVRVGAMLLTWYLHHVR
jgi:hypothetical protein